MASVFYRGTASNPRLFARWKGPDGKWRSTRVHQPTREEALAVAIGLEAQAEREAVGIALPRVAQQPFGDVLNQWSNSLRHADAQNDRGRIRNHLLPRLGSLRLCEIGSEIIESWLEEMRTAAAIAPGTQRHLVDDLRRCFRWAIDRGWITENPILRIPIRLIPKGSYQQLEEGPWISEDSTVSAVFAALPHPIDLMFLLGNRCGAKTGELCGLRISDAADAHRGVIYVRWKCSSPTKPRELPSPPDVAMAIQGLAARRRSQGADSEAFLFVKPDGHMIRKDFVNHRWDKHGRPIAGMTFSRATRDSFAMRALTAGVPFDHVASALGITITALRQRASRARWRLFDERLLRPMLAPAGPMVLSEAA